MFSVPNIFLALLIPSIQSTKPTLKLTFTPDEKYYAVGTIVDILCELINPTEQFDSPQLWHVDVKTSKHTPITRALLNRPTEDALEVFKQNRQHRLEYVKKNHMRIRQILIEDTARYKCNCPDCEDSPGSQERDFQVMKLVDPYWRVEPAWPLHEGTQTSIKCTADDFYPYVAHHILRNHHDIVSLGKATLPTSNTYPQKFSWEATVKPQADWHNTTLRCTIIEGYHERHATKVLDVLFTPRFVTCVDKQHVDPNKEKAAIECTYAGNPKPTLTWLRQNDGKPITSDPGITIKEVDEHHGKYKSIVTFERDKLINIPLTTTTGAPDDLAETQPQTVIENYYQQLLNGGFIARLSYKNDVKASQTINVFSDANQARTNSWNSSAPRTIIHLSTSTLLLFMLSTLRYMIHQH